MDPEKKARLGTRYTCFGCGVRFYDLNKPEPICPKCGVDQRDTPPEEPKPKAKAKRKRKKKAKKSSINPALIEEDAPTKNDEDTDLAALDIESGDDNIQLEIEEG